MAPQNEMQVSISEEAEGKKRVEEDKPQTMQF